MRLLLKKNNVSTMTLRLRHLLKVALTAIILLSLTGGISSCGSMHSYWGVENHYDWGDDGHHHHHKPPKKKKHKKHKKHKRHHHHDDDDD